MKYNFDEIIPREHTACMKYDLRKSLFGEDDVLPFWVADMDFRTPDFIINSMKDRLDHEIFGYPLKPEGFEDAVQAWMKKRHQWEIQKNWITVNPGVVPTLAFSILEFSNPGDEVIVQPPVYFPFFYIVENNGRKVLNNPLILKNGRYSMDLDDLKRKISARTKLIMLCSPHNPGGSVWKEDELRQLAEICGNNNILILSDEIHSDLILPGHKHIPTALLSEEIAANTITTMSSSKTFNTAGLSQSFTIISNPVVRERLNNKLNDFHLSFGNVFGLEAMRSAYLHGEEWLDQLLEYIEANIQLMERFIKSNLPELKIVKPEGTYLVWIDFSGLDLSVNELKDLLIKSARIGLSDGKSFGQGGEGFQRWNVACPRSVLEKGLHQLFGAIKDYQENEEE